MKKIIIAAAIILTSGVTALCITKTGDKPAASQIKIEKVSVAAENNGSPKADISSAD